MTQWRFGLALRSHIGTKSLSVKDAPWRRMVAPSGIPRFCCSTRASQPALPADAE